MRADGGGDAMSLPGIHVQDTSRSQWYTPRDTAARIVEWSLAPLATYSTVLEPSAGDGALALAIRNSARPVAIGSPVCVDIDAQNCERLLFNKFETFCADFLEWSPPEHFDIAIMNPPFEGGQTERHILHALQLADRVVCHCPVTTLAGKARREGLWSQVLLKRLAICSTRPKYGARSGATDMCTIEVVKHDRDPIDPMPCTVEFWP
jgi:predicted RNA methylase